MFSKKRVKPFGELDDYLGRNLSEGFFGCKEDCIIWILTVNAHVRECVGVGD